MGFSCEILVAKKFRGDILSNDDIEIVRNVSKKLKKDEYTIEEVKSGNIDDVIHDIIVNINPNIINELVLDYIDYIKSTINYDDEWMYDSNWTGIEDWCSNGRCWFDRMNESSIEDTGEYDNKYIIDSVEKFNKFGKFVESVFEEMKLNYCHITQAFVYAESNSNAENELDNTVKPWKDDDHAIIVHDIDGIITHDVDEYENSQVLESNPEYGCEFGLSALDGCTYWSYYNLMKAYMKLVRMNIDFNNYYIEVFGGN